MSIQSCVVHVQILERNKKGVFQFIGFLNECQLHMVAVSTASSKKSSEVLERVFSLFKGQCGYIVSC